MLASWPAVKDWVGDSVFRRPTHPCVWAVLPPAIQHTVPELVIQSYRKLPASGLLIEAFDRFCGGVDSGGSAEEDPEVKELVATCTQVTKAQVLKAGRASRPRTAKRRR